MGNLKYVLYGFLILLIIACSENKNETIIYLVRHAEKDTTVHNDNPPLILTGEARAEQLARELQDEKIKYIFSTKYDRNIHTVKPLSNAKKKEIHIYEYHNWQPMLDTLKSVPGTHLICGHGDNILPMIKALGGNPEKEKLGHQEYDKLFKVKITEDTTTTDMLIY